MKPMTKAGLTLTIILVVQFAAVLAIGAQKGKRKVDNTFVCQSERGKQVCKLSDTLGMGEKHDYLIKARSGDTMTVKLEANGPLFNMYTPSGSDFSDGPQRCFADDIPKTGDYLIQVQPTKGTGQYALTVQLERVSPIASNSRSSRDPLFLPNCPPTVTVSASASTVKRNGRVQLQTNATDPDGDTLRYTWSTSGGRIVDDGPNATLDLSGAAPGTYTVTVEVDDGCGCRGCHCKSKFCNPCGPQGPAFSSVTVTVVD